MAHSAATPEAHEGFDAKTRAILALLAGVVFMAVVNGTMINVALPHIGRDFSVTEGTYGWLVTGYALAFGIFNAVNGRLADVLGKKRMYLFGVLALGASSLAVAASPNIESAIGLRVFQGAGAAALPVLGTSIIKDIVSSKRQGRAVGTILSTVGVAASIGPFLGGIIVQFAHWRVVFLVTGLSLIALPFAWKLLPDELNETSDQRFDWFGAILLGVGVASLLYGFNLLENQSAWWKLGGLIGGGVLSLAAFGVWITRAKDPFVSPATFARPGYIACCASGALTNSARFGSIVLAPIFLTEVNGLEPIGVGAVLFPGALMIAILSSKAGDWADASGPKAPVGIGLAAMVLGGLVTAYFAGGSPWGVGGGLTLFGIGFAFTQSPLVSTVNRILPRAESGAGLGVFMMIFFAGGAAGVAASVTAVELQPAGIDSVLGLVTGPGGRYTNAVLLLTAICVTGFVFVAMLPTKEAMRALPDDDAEGAPSPPQKKAA